MITNRYPGHCARCHSHVPAGKGIAFREKGGGWATACTDCANPTIAADLDRAARWLDGLRRIEGGRWVYLNAKPHDTDARYRDDAGTVDVDQLRATTTRVRLHEFFGPGVEIREDNANLWIIRPARAYDNVQLIRGDFTTRRIEPNSTCGEYVVLKFPRAAARVNGLLADVTAATL